MGIWKHQNGEPVCAVCGTEKWKIDAEKREVCCKTSTSIGRADFLLRYFGAGAHTDPDGPGETYVPTSTLKEFHEEYLLAGVDSLETYIQQTTVAA